MKLSETQIKELSVSSRNSTLIASVKEQESQLRVFTEEMSESELRNEKYFDDLLCIIKKRMSSKFERISDFITYPLPIVLDNDAILNDFYKVFEGKNRYFNVTADRDLTRLKEWISKVDVVQWIEQNIKDVWSKKPCSFVVVDVNSSGPYLINVDSSRLIDADFSTATGQLNYISFVHSIKEKNGFVEKRIAVYDSEKYCVVLMREDTDEIKIESTKYHNIGYCPAHSFITESSNQKNLFKRRVAFSKALSKMEIYTLFQIYRNYLDHYAPFPVTESPKNKCANPECIEGKIPQQIVTNPKTNETKTIYNDCQTCGGGKNDGKLIGPGRHIGINVTNKGNDGSGVFRMIFPETDKLKYLPEKLDKLLTNIKYNVVGVNGVIDKEAINELQAKGGFESMESVILRNKKNLDYLYKWIVKTAAKLFYTNIEPSIDANFGTEWYLLSEEDLQKKYDNAKKIGLPIEELKMIYLQLIETKYKGDDEKIKRQKMLLSLDVMPLFSIEDCIKLKNESIVDDYMMTYKVNFNNYIERFEGENGSINQFGIALDYHKRISIIKDTLNRYNKEFISSRVITKEV